MAYIFTKGQCAKADLYDMVIKAMTDAGWKDVSGSPTLDGNVMYSTGVNADKALFVQLSPYANVTNSSANETTYSSRTTNYCNWKARITNNYVPGANISTPGTYQEAARAWITLMPINTVNANKNTESIPTNALIDYRIFVDKSKVIMAFKASDVYSDKYNMIYIGEPDTLYCNAENGRGMIITSSYNASIFSSSAYMCDYPDATMGSIGDGYYRLSLSAITPTKSPNLNNKYFLSDIYIQAAAYGMIGKLDGIFSLTYSGINAEDTITYNGATYLVIDVYQIATSNGFPTSAIAVQIS